MFAIAARRMGYRVHTFSPDADTPTGQVADLEVIAPYDDLDAVRRFAAGVSVVTFEFENVPAATAAAAAEHAPVRPARRSPPHHAASHPRENFSRPNPAFRVTPFRTVLAPTIWPAPSPTSAALDPQDRRLRLRRQRPSPRHFARRGRSRVDIHRQRRPRPRSFIAFEREVSVVAARGYDGAFVDWGVIENRHRNHILDLSIAPASVSDRPRRAKPARSRAPCWKRSMWSASSASNSSSSPAGRLLINELAPRPHNSGHLTFDASVTSQFEQQLRAVCGLPSGRPSCSAPPRWPICWATSGAENRLASRARASRREAAPVRKTRPAPGTKMGHLTALAADPRPRSTACRPPEAR